MRHFTSVLALLFLFGLIAGCATTSSNGTPGTAGSGDDSINSGSTADYENMNYYYDFDDILVPGDLEMDNEQTYVHDSNAVRTGKLVFNGKVEHLSLVDFFIENMNKDGWDLENSFKSKKSLLVFTKENKKAIIYVFDESFNNTHVEIMAEEVKTPGSRSKKKAGVKESNLPQ